MDGYGHKKKGNWQLGWAHPPIGLVGPICAAVGYFPSRFCFTFPFCTYKDGMMGGDGTHTIDGRVCESLGFAFLWANNNGQGQGMYEGKGKGKGH
jgi:hypothetical protein